jgi:hypothetical protein
MAAIEKVIDRLTKRKIQEAVDGVTRPLSKDAFELGRLSGIQHGLGIAQQIIQEALNEDESQSTTTASRKR